VHCERKAAQALREKEDAESVRSLFDWEGWAREFVMSEQDRKVHGPAQVVDSDDSDEDEDAPLEIADADGADMMEVDDILFERKKPKVLRKRYTLSKKIELLNKVETVRKALAKISKPEIAPAAVELARICDSISFNSGVPAKTLDKWIRKEKTLRERYVDKFNRRLKNFGSGSKPRFPKSELAVSKTVTERREAHKAVSKGLIIRLLESEAKKENNALLEKYGISDDIFFGFLWRRGFSFRKPSNIKSLSKTESVKLMRGFWIWLFRVLSGEIPIPIGETDAIDPKYGRFPPRARKNTDEVPGKFGSSSDIISKRGESSTILQVIEGWGDRFCTWRLCAGPGGLDLPVGVIFKGTGKKVSEAELQFYAKLKNIAVLFQENAWVDTTIELKLIEVMMKPIIAKTKDHFFQNNQPFPGLLLLEDNFKPHFAEYVSFF
jgi:hypothetical protein